MPGVDPPSASVAVAKLRLRARHLSLTELVDMDAVTWNEETGTVEKGTEFEEARADFQE